MNELMQRETFREFLKFAIVGVLSTIIDWGVFYILEKFSLYYLIAKIFSFSLAVINSYIWNRKWTFRSHNLNKTQEFSKFMLAALIGLGINTLIFYFAVSYLHLIYLYSLIIATAIVLSWNFTINKIWVFKK